MNSASAEPATSSPAHQPAVEFIRTQRQTAAYVFLGLSLVFLVGTIWLAVRAFSVAKAAEKPAETKPLEPEQPKAELANPKRPSYMVGWIGALGGFLVTASIGVYLQAVPPKQTLGLQLREARVVLLAAGGIVGAGLILFGGIYFYLWSDSLVNWLDKKQLVDAKWVLGPLVLGVILGAGLVFASIQPARAEERNDLMLRRLVYGANFAVTVLLLLVALLVVNVVVAMKVPNLLDTTETGFYTLSDATKKFLGKLPEPATLYVILPDSGTREANDIRQFAYSAQEASDGKMNLRFVSPVTNKRELAQLQEKYSRVGRDPSNRDAYGVLVTVGEDEKRYSFIPLKDLFETDPRTGELKGFAGEVKVMRELRFLADNEQRPVVYFTQGNGELNIGGNAAAELLAAGPTANALKSFLERNYLDVRPLAFPAKDPSVPNDASVVVVAEPQSPLSPAAVDALRQYMTARKGKLIVLDGAAPGPNDKGVAKTGLEGLLAEFNVRLGDKFIYSFPTQDLPEYRLTIAMFNPNSQNPIAQAYSKKGLIFQTPREVAPIQGGNAQFQAATLALSPPGRLTWLQDDPVSPNDLEKVLTDLENNEAVQSRKLLSTKPRSLGVVVTESGGSPHGGPGGAGRLVVIGNSSLFSDRVAERTKSAPLDMIGIAVDWLRDRPPLVTEAESKKYKEYQPPEPATIDTTRLVYLPLGLALLLVTGLGAGVWMIRRK
jgi:hypothetical protein